MLAPLNLQSELFSATGGAAAEGVSNQLGRPRADRFTLLVREAIQNSWDARLAPSGSVQFKIDGYLLDMAARRVLAERVFADVPSTVDIRARLLADCDFPILAISDFGTRGLSGPTRGDIVPLQGESTNFVDFMRYIGRPPNRAYAGGTYGFGKAAYFLASSLKTICVHTSFKNSHGMESRFMAAALGPQFESTGHGGKRFTGRHWWGRSASDEVVDPVLGDEADALAHLLGGSQRNPDTSGTTIYVLAPDFEGVAPQTVLFQMGRAIMEYFWPKLIDGPSGTPTMSFSVRWQGEELALPVLQEEPELALLARAFATACAKLPSNGAVLEPITSQRPKKLLGHLALVRQPATQMGSAPTANEAESEASGLYRQVLRRPLRQIAVMRAPNFVVKYLDGPLVPYELAEYAGVFRVDAEVDTAFARAEPPTHDDWVPDLLLDSNEKTYVRVALRKVKEAVDIFTAPVPIEVAGTERQSVVDFSRMLGGLVPSLIPSATEPTRPKGAPTFGGGTSKSSGGASAAGSSGGSGAGGRTTVAQVSFVGEPTIELVDNVAAMFARFEVSGLPGTSARISALPKVMIAEGFESDPPEGAQRPKVLKWIRPDGGTTVTEANSCDVPTNSGTWIVAVSIPPDAMISVTLKAEAGSHI